MGPNILLDKSVIQSLSFDDIDFLNRYYYLNIPSVLIMEILGDLKKPSKEGEGVTKEKVKYLFNKISRQSLTLNSDYRYLLFGDLHGHKITMDGRPILSGGRVVKGKSGEKGIVLEVSPEEELINKWKVGDFSTEDNVTSQNWRDFTKSVDLEDFQRKLRPVIERLGQPKDMESLVVLADKLLAIKNYQALCISLLVIQLELDNNMNQSIFLRWEQSGCPFLKDYAPYSYYCARVLVLFNFGLACGLFGTRTTNLVDLEYLFYLPFCKVFSSSDKFQISLAKLCLKPEQEFVHGNDLKADLTEISLQCNCLSGGQKADWLSKYGRYPPGNSSSVTSQLWSKFCSPRKSLEQHKSEPMTEEQKAELRKRMKDFDDADIVTDHEDLEKVYSDPEFIIKKGIIHIDDPCPCGSGKKLRDCHLEEIRASEEKNRDESDI